MQPAFYRFFLLFAFSLSALHGVAQQTIVKGKVTDANSGDPIPFANVVFKGTSIGTTTDFDGNYLITTGNATDSLQVTYVGYLHKVKAVRRGVSQVINFQLDEERTALQEVVVYAGENPAFDILRKVVRNKSRNDKRKLTAYEYDTYTKIEVDVDKISEEMRERKIMKKISAVLDSVDRIAGEDGKPILPLFITEAVSKVYYRDAPSLKKEHILKSKISGVGVEDGSLVTQVIGSSFQEYNFYQNWLTILNKEFVSPIADGWRLYYDYDLTDSLMLGGEFCYRLDFFPRSPQDLAFAGTIWITKADYALKQIDATVGAQANINFVEKIKIQQELQKTELGYWLPVKNRVLIDVGELSRNSAGMLAKFYTSNRNFVVNQPHPPAFYEPPILTAEDARLPEPDVTWDTLRHEPLSSTEKNVYRMIDTLKSIPVIRTYTDIIKTLVSGYFKAGKVDVGPYLGLASWNTIEGVRLQAGLRTNAKFSRRWVFAGQLGYGFDDQRVKYFASAQRILSRDRWTTLTVSAHRDLGRIGIDEDNLVDNPIFLAASRWGNFRRGYYAYDNRVTFKRELFKGFSQKIMARYFTFEPTFAFGYVANPEDVNSPVIDQYQSAEVVLESRYARDELFLQNDNERISLGTNKWPVITLRYTRGISGVMSSDLDYDKLRLSVTKRMAAGTLGVGYVTLQSEYVFNTVPYPLLSLHLGNQTPIYSPVTFNLMNFGEFVSDHYASLQYRHYFEGFLFNRVPLLRKLNWRMLATANVLMGGMRDANKALIAAQTPEGEPTLLPGFLDSRPYVELGYGVENIFRFLRVDFVHRLTYLDKPDVRNFGILFTAQFQL